MGLDDDIRCRKCGTPLVRALIDGVEVLVCPKCGTIYEEDLLSTESEQRFFEIEEVLAQNRLIRTPQDHPALANSQPYLGSNITENYRSRRILEIREKVHELANKLDIADDAKRKAVSLLLDFNQKRNLKQRDLIAFVLVALHVATRLTYKPIPLDDILRKTNISKKDFSKALRLFTGVLKLKLPPARPSAFIRYIADRLSLSHYSVKIAEGIARAVESKMRLSGRDPLSVAAACMFIAAEFTGEVRPQRDFASVVYCTEVTLRNRIKEVYDLLGGRKEIAQIVGNIYPQLKQEPVEQVVI